jgi:predicted RNA-binding Zn-ribbon protein involved in translation (DUF1610 family)
MKIMLKSCPFCGGDVIKHCGLAGTGTPKILFFHCQEYSCGAIVSFNNAKVTHHPSLAVFNWEERTAHKAEWIRSEEGYIYCSSCKREVRDFGGRHESKFCPNCGSFMGGRNNGEEE